MTSCLVALVLVTSLSPSPTVLRVPRSTVIAPAPQVPLHARPYLTGPAPVAPPLPAALPQAASSAPCSAAGLSVSFGSNPLAGAGALTLTGPGTAAFTWDRRGQALRVHLDSSQPPARAAAPLGRTLTGADCFRFGAVFTIESVVASPDDFFQLGFGLTNSATTGFNRTGTAPLFGDADTFDSLEVSYFPNVTFFGGPFLSPGVFGAAPAFGDAFSNFASVFGPPADLGDNPAPLAARLPVGVRLQAEVRHDPGTQLLTLSIINLSGPRPAVVETALVPLDLAFVNGNGTFTVDELSITSWFDAADFDPSTTALLADLAFHSLYFEDCCPLP